MSTTPEAPADLISAARVSFVVPVRNDAAGLARCLSSIRAQGAGPEIVVIDNGSLDESVAVAQSFGARVLQIPDCGVSTLRNRGVAAARGDLIAFVDADMQLNPGWLDRALSLLVDPQVVGVGAEYRAPSNANQIQQIYDGMREPTLGTTDTRWLPTGNMVVRRVAFDTIGGFDESLRTCEDWDLCVRLKEHGRLLADGELRSSHFGDPATLKALYHGELWRGGDNLRVSLRRVPEMRDLPGILIPVIWLVSAIVAAGALIATPAAGLSAVVVAVAALAVVAGLSLLRALRTWRRVRHLESAGFVRTWLVSIVFDMARAMALVFSVPHRRAVPLRVARATPGEYR